MVADRIGRFAMGDLPGDVALGQVDGGDAAIGRLEQRQSLDGDLSRTKAVAHACLVRSNRMPRRQRADV